MSVDLRPDAIAFADRLEDAELEEGTRFAPRFDADGLIPVITTDADSGEVLMFAWVRADALRHTPASAAGTASSANTARPRRLHPAWPAR